MAADKDDPIAHEAQLRASIAELEAQVARLHEESQAGERRVADVLAIAQDASQGLRRAEQALRMLLEGSPDGTIVHRRGRVVYANPAAVVLLGYESAEDLAGHDFLALVHAADRDRADQRIRRMLETDEGQRPIEKRMLRHDGRAVVMEVSALPILFEGDRAIVCVMRDVSERKQIEARLLLADRMASMGTLAAGVAHEINNPLGYTIANVGYALDELRALESDLASVDPSDSPGDLDARLSRARSGVQQILDALQEARQGADRVRLIVRDLKTFSRVDDDTRRPVDVRRVIESSINMAYNEIRHRARLVKDYAPTPMVDGNEARLGQVFLNLLVNAAQAIREGDAEHNAIRVVTGVDERGRCTVDVTDTGQGIAPEDQRKIFDPFFTTKQGSGTGLGLSICHNIVTSLGGEIAVRSEPGKGTTFRVTLPRAVEQGASAHTPVPSSLRPVRATVRGRVLVVDDEPMMARAVQRLLEADHDVTSTSDPVHAVDQVRSGARYDAILCDLMMPTMTGMDVYEAIRGFAPDQAERIVFMTGGAFTPRASQFLESVDNPRLEKPIDRAALRAAIRGNMGSSPSSSPSSKP